MPIKIVFGKFPKNFFSQFNTKSWTDINDGSKLTAFDTLEMNHHHVIRRWRTQNVHHHRHRNRLIKLTVATHCFAFVFFFVSSSRWNNQKEISRVRRTVSSTWSYQQTRGIIIDGRNVSMGEPHKHTPARPPALCQLCDFLKMQKKNLCSSV